MITTVTLINIGFSIVVAGLFLVIYVAFLHNVNKSWFAIGTCFLFLASISCLQFEHISVFLNHSDPIEGVYYRCLLFIVPPTFFLFSRAILFPELKPQVFTVVHMLPIALVFILKRDLAVPLAFMVGVGYCSWLVSIIYRLRRLRKQYAAEIFFYGFFLVLALLVLIFGFSISYVSSAYFYYFYANGISAAFILVTASFIIYPNLLAELNEIVALSYSKSTLNKVDIGANLEKLECLMKTEKLHRNEDVSLSITAKEMAMSSHQLSELINTQFGVSFSKYIRQQRVEDALEILKQDVSSSILSVSMELGFRSQSSFYAAFKEITGQSPGSYRKQSV